MPEAPELDLRTVNGLRRSLRTPDGCNHLLYRHGDQLLQLRISGVALSNPVQLLTEAFIGPVVLKARLCALKAFNQLSRGEIVPRRFLAATPSSRRLYFVLRALDGSLAGASYKEIAVVLFGADRVRSDWGRDSDHLKNRIRRAVLRGKMLTAGDYRRLLMSHPSNRGAF